MSALSGHRKLLHEVFPPLDYVMKYTDQGPYPGDHWFWRDGRRNHGLDKRGQAYLRWKVKPTASSGYKVHGDFNVVRLLLAARGPVPPRSRYTSVCGLSQCVNPDHWRRVDPPTPWRLQVRDDGAWQLVRIQTDKPADRTIVVHMLHGNDVHVVSIAPQVQRAYEPPPVAMCGAALPPLECVVTAALVTCGGCS
jgi:hypothetical protein